MLVISRIKPTKKPANILREFTFQNKTDHSELVNSPRSKLKEFKTRTDSQLFINARSYSFRATAWMANCGLMGRNPSSPQSAGIRVIYHLTRTLCLCLMSSLRSSVISFRKSEHLSRTEVNSESNSVQSFSSLRTSLICLP